MERDDKQAMWSPRRHSCIPDFIQQHQPWLNVRYHLICLKDARDIDTDDLVRLVICIKKSRATKIVIVHGYQTMADSMDYLEQEL